MNTRAADNKACFDAFNKHVAEVYAEEYKVTMNVASAMSMFDRRFNKFIVTDMMDKWRWQRGNKPRNPG